MEEKSIFNASSDMKIKSMIQSLQIVFDNLPCAISILDPVKNEKDEIIDFIFAYANSIALTDLGLQRVEIFGKKISGIFPQSSEVLINTCNKALVDENSHNIHIYGNIKGSGKRRVKNAFDAVITKADTAITLSWKCVGPHKKEGDNLKVEEVVKIPKQEYDTLKKSEELFSRTFYLSPDAYIISRMTDGKILQINNSAEILFGYSKSEIIGKNSNQLGLFADINDRENAVDLLNEKGSLRDFSTVIERKTGEKQQVSLAIEVITIGNEKYVLKSIRDISERKRIEDALCESEKRYRTTLDNMLEGCAILGYDWTYMYINKVYSQHAHKKQEELIGRNLLEVFPGVENSEFFDYYKICMEERVPQHIESSFTFDDGLTAWYQAIVQPVPEGIFSLSIDITERKNAEKELKRSKEILTLILDHINEGIIVSNAPDGKIAAISRWGINHTIGRSVDAVIDLPVEHYLEQWDVRDIKTGEEIEPERLPIARALNGETIRNEEWLMKRSDGTSFVTSVNAVPIYDEEKIKIISAVATWVDITERKRAEETITTRMVELETILDSIADGVIIYDNKGKIVRSNAAANEILKYPQIDREATMHERIKERYGVWSENGSKLTPEEMPAMRAITYGETVKGVLVRVQGAGDPRWVNVSAAPLFVSGKQTGAVASMSDITERKKAEEALQKSEHRFRTLVTVSSEVLYRMSPDWSEMFQLNGHDFLVDTESANPNWLQEYIHPDDQAQIMSVINEAVQTKSTFQLEHRVRQADGSWGWTYSRAVPLMDADGKIIEWFGAAADFTKRKQAEEKLLESEERLKFVVENSPDNIFIQDLDLRYIWVGRPAYPLTRDEYLGRTDWDLNLPENAAKLTEIKKKVIESGQRVIVEIPLTLKDLNLIFEATYEPWCDSKGSIIGIAGYVRDITERKKAEETIIKTKEQYELLFNSLGEGFALYKAVYNENHKLIDLLVLEINPAGAAFSGVKREEQIGKTWKQVWTGIEDSLFDIYREIDRKGEPYVFEHFSGITKRWYINRIYKVADARFAVTFLDITERKKAEETVKESEAKLLDAQKLAHMGNYTVDIKNNAIEWSEELYNIWELEKNKPIPSFEELWNRVHPDDREQVKKVLEREIMANDKVETELRLVFPNNRIKYVQLVTRGIFDEAGNLLKRQGVEIDITERKEAMLRLEKTLKELERSNADLERFAFAASHDLQEPIRMIGSYAQLITKKYGGKLSPSADAYLDFLFEGAQRLQLLVKDMLHYLQLRSMIKQDVSIDLDVLIKNVLKEFDNIISETNAQVTIDSMPVISGDRVQIKQLFYNLLSNAFKFRRKGDIIIINVGFEEKDSEWLFRVKDNGIGIEPEYIDSIFSAFKRLNDRELYPGIGLGLVISRRIVERHGGRIWVESEPGAGSVFNFTISKDQGKL